MYSIKQILTLLRRNKIFLLRIDLNSGNRQHGGSWEPVQRVTLIRKVEAAVLNLVFQIGVSFGVSQTFPACDKKSLK